MNETRKKGKISVSRVTEDDVILASQGSSRWHLQPPFSFGNPSSRTSNQSINTTTTNTTMSSSGVKQLVRKFKTLPITLYRIQARRTVNLREYETQMAKGRASYDLKLHNGLVHPAEGDEWIGPNGMSLRPATDTMVGILENWRGDPTIFRLSEGLRLPESLIVLHERDDHWSLQTTEPVTLAELNERMTQLLDEAPTQTRQQFMEQLEDLDDQDN